MGYYECQKKIRVIENFNNILKLYKFRNIPIHDNNTHQTNINKNVSSTSASDEPINSLNITTIPNYPDSHEASLQIVHQINEFFLTFIIRHHIYPHKPNITSADTPTCDSLIDSLTLPYMYPVCSYLCSFLLIIQLTNRNH